MFADTKQCFFLARTIVCPPETMFFDPKSKFVGLKQCFFLPGTNVC